MQQRNAAQTNTATSCPEPPPNDAVEPVDAGAASMPKEIHIPESTFEKPKPNTQRQQGLNEAPKAPPLRPRPEPKATKPPDDVSIPP